MKKILLFVFFTTSIVFAQKELWAYKMVAPDPDPMSPNLIYDGQIIKSSLTQTNSSYEVIHTFDPTGVLGKIPQGKLLLASNGKLYGVTSLDIAPPNAEDSSATLFEFDAVLNKYTVLYNSFKYPRFGLIEFSPGILMGFMNEGRTIFKYNFISDEFSILATIPTFNSGWFQEKPKAISQLSKSANGNFFFTTDIAPTINNGVNFPGGIYKFNPINNIITREYYFGQDLSIEYPPYFPTYNTALIEGSPGVFYGVTREGGIHRNQPNEYPSASNGSGTIYEYTVATNTMVKKYDFDYNGVGYNALELTRLNNTKFYGTLFSIQDGNFPNSYGSIYEFDISTNSFTIIHVANPGAAITEDLDYHYASKPLLATDGNLYGTSTYGLYKYDFNTDRVTNKVTGFGGFFEITEPIEICRKPSYQEFLPNNYAPEQGTDFTFDVQNTNATMYVWKKGTTILPTQTTGILNLPSVTISDTGVYTCTMTNECGTTITANLNVNVTNLAIETVANYKSEISLYPNPTKGIINLKFPENRGLKAIKYKITNLLGQVVLENDIAKNNTPTSVTIDTAGFANGMYQVTLLTDKGNWNGKFVKE